MEGLANTVFTISQPDRGYEDSQIEGDCKEEDEAGNGQVNPLHVFQSLFVNRGLEEEDVGAKHWSHHCPNAIESLRNVYTDLGVSWWTAHYVLC